MKSILVALAMFVCSVASASDNIVILLDTSGSMDTAMKSSRVTRMKAAQDAICSVIQQMPNETKLGILTFNGWIYPLDNLDKDKATQAVNATRAGGGTPLGQFLKDSTDALLEARQKNKGYGTYKLLIVTDGDATDTNLFNKYLPDVASRGIVLNSIGVDMGADHALSKKSRNYMRADDPESLNKAVTLSLAEVKNAADSVGDFENLNGLDNDSAKVIIACVTDQANTPIGVERVIKVTNPQGQVVEVAMTEPGNAGMPTWQKILIGVCGAFLFMLVINIIFNK